MKKILFLLPAVLIVALSIIACQKDNTVTEVIPVPASGDVVSDRADCGGVMFQIDGAQLGTGDYARITYTNPSNTVVTVNLTLGAPYYGFYGPFTIKAGTTIGFKHRLTCNVTGPTPLLPTLNYIKTHITSGGVTKYYKYISNASGSVRSWLCDQTNCTLSGIDACGGCTDVPYTAPISTPDYWCN